MHIALNGPKMKITLKVLSEYVPHSVMHTQVASLLLLLPSTSSHAMGRTALYWRGPVHTDPGMHIWRAVLHVHVHMLTQGSTFGERSYIHVC